MVKRYAAADLAALAVDRRAGMPMYRQLYFAIRDAILDGRLRPGLRLPASRALAAELSVARNTVVLAFEQLLAEGYVEARVGAGTYVSETLPESLLAVRAAPGAPVRPKVGPQALSRRGAYLARIRPMAPSRPIPFSPGLPELDAFPFDIWSRLLARHWRRPDISLLAGGAAAGARALREAIAAYLGASRAVVCTPDQVVIVSGAQQALDLAARALIDPGDSAWIEEPGYPGIQGALLAAGADLVPVPVDSGGIDVAEGRTRAPRARLAVVTPSHQYPLGATMPLARRLELLDWARQADAFVIEDDYDSEYRYSGRPLAALQGLDEDGRVIYVGTFSKVMFPGLRLGYMVVPAALVDAMLAIRRLLDVHPSGVVQAALAEFIEQGYLAGHIRRMRPLYAARQAALLDRVTARLGDRLILEPDESGMHLVGCLDDTEDDRAISAAALRHGVEAPALSRFYQGRARRKGLLLGYAGVTEVALEKALTGLAAAFDDV
jgi:GntR family transcriptional regulator/MocR family aminotransferase